MQLKEFQITIYSESRFIIAFFVIMSIFAFLIEQVFWSNNKMIVAIQLLAVLLLSDFLSDFFGKAKVKLVAEQWKYVV